MARRDLRRHPGRTAAAVVMVFLPVLAASATAVVLTTTDLSAEEYQRARLGGGEVLVTWDQFSAGAYPTGADGAAPDGVVLDGTEADGEPRTAADGPPDQQTVERLLGARVLEVVRGSVRVATDERAARPAVAGAQSVVTDLGDRLSDGLLVVLEGRLPDAVDEVAVTPGLAEALQVDVGSTVVVGGDEKLVVGLGVERWQDATDAGAFLTTGGAAPPRDGWVDVSWVAGEAASGRPAGDLEPGSGLVVWHGEGASGLPVGAVTGGGTGGRLVVAVVVALATLEIALLAGPAFAVGVRQQQRTLALLSATGGDARALRRVVLAQAVLVGAVSSLAAAVVGVVVPAVALGSLRYRVAATIGPLDVPWAVVLGFVVVGTVAATASALVPALTAARATVVGGLALRPARARVPWRRPLAGAVLVGVGTLMLAVAIDQGRSSSFLGVDVDAATVGSLSVLVLGVGMVLLVPLPVALAARATRSLPLGVRLAGRETTRAGTRSVAAAAAVAGATAALVGATCLTSALAEEQRQRYVPRTAPGVSLVSTGDPAVARERVEAALPTWRTALVGAAGAQEEDGDLLRADYWLPTPGCEDVADATGGADGVPGDCVTAWLPREPGGFQDPVAVLDAQAAGLLGYDLDEEQQAVLDDGGVLVAAGAPVLPGRTTELREWSQTFEVGGGPDPAGRSSGAVTVEVARYDPVPGPRSGEHGGQAALVVSPQAAERLSGWYPTGLLAAPPDAAEMTRREALAAGERLRDVVGDRTTDRSGQPQPTEVVTEVGYRDGYRLAELLLLGVAALVVLGATFTATALALADARADRTVLTALGASPRTQRATAGATAALLALVGAVLGAVVGLVPGLMVGDAMLEPSVVSYGLGVTDGTFVASGTVLDVVPWESLAAGVLGLPVLAGLVVAAVASGRPAAEAARASARER